LRQGLKQLPRKGLGGSQNSIKRATLGAPFAAVLARLAPRSSAESPLAAP
jgi:hypothetical protein